MGTEAHLAAEAASGTVGDPVLESLIPWLGPLTHFESLLSLLNELLNIFLIHNT